MEKSRVTNSFIVRVEETSRGKRIVVQDLKTREKFNFDSWEAFSRHMHLKTNLKELANY